MPTRRRRLSTLPRIPAERGRVRPRELRWAEPTQPYAGSRGPGGGPNPGQLQPDVLDGLIAGIGEWSRGTCPRSTTSASWADEVSATCRYRHRRQPRRAMSAHDRGCTCGRDQGAGRGARRVREPTESWAEVRRDPRRAGCAPPSWRSVTTAGPWPASGQLLHACRPGSPSANGSAVRSLAPHSCSCSWDRSTTRSSERSSRSARRLSLDRKPAT